MTKCMVLNFILEFVDSMDNYRGSFLLGFLLDSLLLLVSDLPHTGKELGKGNLLGRGWGKITPCQC